MGIKGLLKFIKKKDLKKIAIKKVKFQTYSWKKIAIDVNLLLKNFILGITNKKGEPIKNKNGEITSHLIGLFRSTINLIKNNIKPVYVFDGEPPALKKDREDQLSDKTKKISDQARKLLDLMGIPHVNAKAEAEAECCAMVKEGIVDIVATDDMDALPFGAKIIIRNITSSPEKCQLEEVNSKNVLKVLQLDDHNQLIDFCILLGCSYCKTIKNIGAVRAHELITKYKNIDAILEYIRQKNYNVPNNWKENFENAKKLLEKPDISDLSTLELKWVEPKKDELIKFLCDENQFKSKYVEDNIKEIKSISPSSSSKRKDEQDTGNGETSKRLRLEKYPKT